MPSPRLVICNPRDNRLRVITRFCSNVHVLFRGDTNPRGLTIVSVSGS